MIIDYDYKEFTEKDMFKIKLKGTMPKFGYMSCTKRNNFFEFCVNVGFIEFLGTANQKKRYAYRVLVGFKYSAMGNYRATDVGCKQGEIIVVDGAFRPCQKLIGSSSSSLWAGIKPPKLSDFDDA